jgi:glycine hydroxymethyltransferase
VIDFEAFAHIAESAKAYLMVDMAHIAGLVAVGIHPSPIPFADVVTSTTHKTLRGPRGGLILAKSEFGAKLNREIFPGIQGGPLMHVIAAKAVAFKEAMEESFKTYQKDVVENSKVLASHLTKYGIKLVSGGTDNHMMIVDLRDLNITGNIAENVLDSAGITVNKNSIPFEKLSPTVTSGIRIGTPAITTRGMRAPEMQIIARLIVDVLQNHKDDSLIKSVKAKVHEICEAFPIYKNQFQRTG